ncbi:hypothetical protein [Levilactobacillus mulengensis]|uniref:hypothetical protein n=1 Tax=Levilactobacillus mulengensis TaxID=2486025 RepID=UPI000F79E1A6|nr:hypothetical protein [Levilactobacillus mulengensis]
MIVMGEHSRATYGGVLDLLDGIESEWNPNQDQAPADTNASKRIFEVEEGKEDSLVRKGKLIRNGKQIRHRRDWLILADIYNNGEYTQGFHLRNYIEFKLHDGATRSDGLYDGRIRNAALYFYIREVVYGDSKEKGNFENEVQKVINHYELVNEDNQDVRVNNFRRIL